MADRVIVKKVGAWKYSFTMFEGVRLPSDFDTESVLEWVELDPIKGC